VHCDGGKLLKGKRVHDDDDDGGGGGYGLSGLTAEEGADWRRVGMLMLVETSWASQVKV